MTCRHGPGDMNCSSHPYQVARQEAARYEDELTRLRAEIAKTPDSEKYEIEDVARVGPHLVMKVRYPNCAKCSYEGNKVMVFLDVAETDVMRWRRIDPHFRSPIEARPRSHAPSPAARFPASPEGWSDALAYARGKERS